MKMMTEHSAGGAVYGQFKMQNAKCKIGKLENQILWLISKHSGYHKWVLPKGIVEQGETAEEAALREVREETGIKAEIIKKIDFEVKYKYIKELPAESQAIQAGQSEADWKMQVDKTVEFYLMKYVSGNTKDHSWEMEEVKWVSGEEALKTLGFESEKKVLKKAFNKV